MWIICLLGIFLCFNEARSAPRDIVPTQDPTDAAVSRQARAPSGVYHLDVTIVNHYGKAVRIRTTHSNATYQNFVIPVGGSYRIKSTSSTNRDLIITANDQANDFPITKDGKKLAFFVSPSPMPVDRVYYIPSGPKDDLSTHAPVVGPTNAVLTQAPTDTTLPPQGVTFVSSDTAVSRRDLTDAFMGAVDPTNGNASPQASTDAALSTQAPTDADLSTQAPANATLSTQAQTNAAVSTQAPTNADALTQAPTDAVVSTQAQTTTAVPTDNSTGAAISTDLIEGPTDAVASTERVTAAVTTDPDVKDVCKYEKIYVISIIALAILLAILLLIVACLVCGASKTKDKTKTSVEMHEPLVDSVPNEDEENNCEGNDPRDNVPTQVPAVCSTFATVSSQDKTDAATTETTTDAAGSAQGPTDAVVSMEVPTVAVVSEARAPTDSAVSSQDPNNAAVSTQPPPNAAVSTKSSADAAVSPQAPADAAVSTQVPTNADVSTHSPADSAVPSTAPTSDAASPQAPTNAAVSSQGPTNAAVITGGATNAAVTKTTIQDEGMNETEL